MGVVIMILMRALNEYDRIMNPLRNGLASKKLIYNATKRYLYNTDRELVEKLSKKELDEYIKNYMYKYLISHKYQLEKIFKRQHKITKDTIHKFVEEKDDFSYCQIVKDLSSLPNHLINGSKTYTNWISTTTNFDSIWNYYDRQKIHEVAVLNVSTNGVFNEDTYVVDVSNKEAIEKLKCISNKIDAETFDLFIKFMKENPEYQKDIVSSFHHFIMRPTNKKFMGFNFAASSFEYSIYEYLPKESIISVLESLQIDLICANLLNEEYYTLSPRKQAQELEKLKRIILGYIQKENNPYMLYVFEELYLKKRNISEITNDTNEQEKMIVMRNKILSKSRNIPSVLIKKQL